MELKQTGQFKKDLKKYKNDSNKLKELKIVLTHLKTSGKVPSSYNPHKLTGDYRNCMECHIEGDFLLIWFDKEKNIIKLLRLGSHSDLFK